MRILHTADWHLGARLADGARHEEHALFLDWLLTEIERREIDGLIVAGDVFDSGSPPAEARALFFRFCADLVRTGCRAWVLAGNHDAPTMLQAPAPVLAALGTTVIGEAPRGRDAALPLVDRGGVTRGWLAAVPFLRPADVPVPAPGADLEQRRVQLVDAVADHYTAIADVLEDLRAPGQFLVATGHLFAQGGALSDSERMIQVGHRLGLPVEVFPPCFDYVALGHLHRPQRLPGPIEVRYSGAPLAMSFAEVQHTAQVVSIELGPGGLREVGVIEVPRARHLLSLTGRASTVVDRLRGARGSTGQIGLFPSASPTPVGGIPNATEAPVRPGWAQVCFEDDEDDDAIEEGLAELGYRLVSRSRTARPTVDGGPETEPLHLTHLDPFEVFRQLVREREGVDADPALEHAFLDLLQAASAEEEA